MDILTREIFLPTQKNPQKMPHWQWVIGYDFLHISADGPWKSPAYDEEGVPNLRDVAKIPDIFKKMQILKSSQKIPGFRGFILIFRFFRSIQKWRAGILNP